MDTYIPFLEGLLRRRGFSAADTADLIQETFVAVVDHIGDFRYDPSKRFRGWLATVALRKAWRHNLRDKRSPKAFGGDGNQEVADGVPAEFNAGEGEEAQVAILLGRLRASLGELEWQVFEMTVIKDTAIDEAAAELAISRGYLYVCRSRAKKTLLRLLEEDDE